MRDIVLACALVLLLLLLVSVVMWDNRFEFGVECVGPAEHRAVSVRRASIVQGRFTQ
jgi:hypothetical protein